MATQLTLNDGSLNSAGALAIKTNGTTQAINITTGQQVEFNDGSASAPSITNTGDGNTGVFFPDADTVGITTGGTERARVDSSGNLGIGTSSPSSALYVKRTSGNSGIYADYNGTNIGRLEAASNGNLYIGLTTGSGDISIGNTSNASAVVLNSSGNLGLGVTPSAWRSTWKAMEFGRVGNAVFGSTSGSSMEILVNGYVDSSNAYRYANNGAASDYYQNGGAHIWYNAASGTAGNAITFTQAMTLDANGNLGVGTTSPASRLNVSAANGAVILDSTTALAANNGTSLNWRAVYDGSGSIANVASILGAKENATSGNYAGYMAFSTESSAGSLTERARIDSSGNLLVGTTSNANVARIKLAWTTGGYGIESVASANTLSYHIVFQNASNTPGAISTTNNATTYATTSDYRLKENIAPMTGALATVAQLKPCTYTWKTDGSSGQGFIAHELQEVVPDAVVGEKDAVKEDGAPQYQNIDTSFLVATLTAALQEMKAIIDDQAARIAALEAK
jgi:hypothetical protein